MTERSAVSAKKPSNISLSHDTIINYGGIDYFIVDELYQQGVSYNYVVVKKTKHGHIKGVYRWNTDSMKKSDILPILETYDWVRWLIPCNKCEYITSLDNLDCLNKYTKEKVEKMVIKNTSRYINGHHRGTKSEIVGRGTGKHIEPVIRCVNDGKEFYSGRDASIEYKIPIGYIYGSCKGKTSKTSKYKDYKFEWIKEKNNG